MDCLWISWCRGWHRLWGSTNLFHFSSDITQHSAKILTYNRRYCLTIVDLNVVCHNRSHMQLSFLEIPISGKKYTDVHIRRYPQAPASSSIWNILSARFSARQVYQAFSVRQCISSLNRTCICLVRSNKIFEHKMQCECQPLSSICPLCLYICIICKLDIPNFEWMKNEHIDNRSELDETNSCPRYFSSSGNQKSYGSGC